MDYRIFVVSAPGMEAITARELAALGWTAQPVAGGVEFIGALRDLYRTNLLLRTASRVTLRLGEFYAAAFSELRKKASRLPWERCLRPGQPVMVRATCHRSKLYHSGAVVERVAGAIGDRLGAPSEVVGWDEESADIPPQMVIVRLFNNQCTVSVDASGALLHRRGYRQATAKAPLRETLAAGMLLASGWDGRSPLLDPFCGSGTIPIEAALLARNIAPGRDRRFAFMDWPDFADDVWAEAREAAIAAERSSTPPLLASDRDAGAIRAAETNATRAGVAGDIAFVCQAVSAIAPPSGPGWVVTNPPYGVRVSAAQDLRNLYAQLGHVLRAHCSGWRVAFLCNDPKLIGQTRLQLDTSIAWANGGLRVRLAQGVVEGSGTA
ncbi:MAG: class I SAM-dependent RNA methyltransferase [Anaerolineae bacterium]|nr:class I SAM-dependent RNA methyltransferase [Anaerolineae bacterium]